MRGTDTTRDFKLNIKDAHAYLKSVILVSRSGV